MALSREINEGPVLDVRADLLQEHLVEQVRRASLEREPFCHFYLEGAFPRQLYPKLLQSLPAPEAYVPLNPRLYARADGKSTRDMFHLTAADLARLPAATADFWRQVVRALTAPELKRVVFAKLAPDLAQRFGIAERDVPDIDCKYDVILFRDTEDYRIKPHPDGLNKIVTMQFYLPDDESTLELGTSLYRAKGNLLRQSFEEVKRFPFKPNSVYAFPVSDSRARKSWHGRDRLSGFTGVRNSLMLLFQQESPREYAI